MQTKPSPLDYYRDRTVIVTGATSGNGAAVARLLLAQGATVIGIGRDLGRLEAFRAAGGIPVRLDLGDLDLVRKVGRDLAFGWSIDAVVHLAGGAAFWPPDEASRATLRRSEVDGPLGLLRTLLPWIRVGGVVGVVTSAVAGLDEIPALADYQRAKAAVATWVREFRPAFERRGLGLTLISMGFVGSAIWTRAEGLPRWAGTAIQALVPGPERYARGILEAVALRREVAYPGLLARWAPVRDGAYATRPAIRRGLALAGRLGLGLPMLHPSNP